MARRVRQTPSPVAGGDGGRTTVGPPWESMDVSAEDRSRREYLALRSRAGGPPVVYAGERPWDVTARLGSAPVSLWWVARFDGDAAIRRQALVAAVDHVRRRIVTHVYWLEQRDPPPQMPAPSPWSTVDAGCDLDRRAHATHPYGGLVGGGVDATPARAVFAELVEVAAGFGLLVTESGVVDQGDGGE